MKAKRTRREATPAGLDPEAALTQVAELLEAIAKTQAELVGCVEAAAAAIRRNL